MFGTLFQFRIAFRTSAFVRFFGGAARCTRLSTNSGPFRSHTNTSPGAAPGSTTRFLLSAVKVMVGLSHTAVHAVKARSGMAPVQEAKSENSRFALRANLVSSRPVQSLATPQKPADALLVSGRQFSARLALPVLFFGALWFVLCRQLSGEWLVNEQYNYGWFVPFFALYLFWLRWQDRRLRRKGQNFRCQISNLAALAIAIAALLSAFAGSSF